MCEHDYENKKLVITKFSGFLQALNSNFRLNTNRAFFKDLRSVVPQHQTMIE